MADPVPSATIKILSEQLINKIAAGEVVERPASIVKELVENSIDAGADQILVTVKNGGKDLISILDNGSGMNEENARLASERHATSKIYAEDDLEKIGTLGFRGEALASIASVSHFELLTCHDETQGATRLSIKGGSLDEHSKTGFPKGTKITIQQLFFNTPARLKFLKTIPTEFRHIQETVLHQALARPHIQFRLTHNQQLVFSLPKGQSLEQRIFQLFGDEFRDSLIPLAHQETYLRYEGFVSIPTRAKTSKRWQYLFVNDRFVKCPTVNRAIYDAHRTLLMKNQHPIFFLKIQLEPSEIDVNVHPAKTEIRFRNNQLIHTILVDHLGTTLMEASHRRHFGNQLTQQPLRRTPLPTKSSAPNSATPLLPEARRTIPLEEQLEMMIGAETAAQAPPQKSTRPPIETQNQQQKSLPNKNKIERESHFHETHEQRKIFAPAPPQKNEVGGVTEKMEEQQTFRVVGQIKGTYILAEKEGNIVLFDQHAASERLLFEQYKNEFQAGQIQTESFLVPILQELSPQNAILLEQYLPQFKQLGFEIEPFGKTTYSIRSLPSILPQNACEATLLAILNELMLFGKSKQRETVFDHILEKVACHAAVNPGELLELETMKQLIAQLEKIDILLYHPHGKPVLIELSYQELEKRFNRTI